MLSVLSQLLADSMTGISASSKQGSKTTPPFCTAVASLADAVCGITENAAQVCLYVCVNVQNRRAFLLHGIML